MTAERTPDEIRSKLDQLAIDRNVSLSALSRKIGRNEAYLQQFVKHGIPKRLGEDDRLVLAKFFQVDERELGAREPWRPER